MTNTPALNLPQRRYSLSNGEHWSDERDCRDSVARILTALLKHRKDDPESIYVLVHAKKSRWLRCAHGNVAKIFPDLWAAHVRAVALSRAQDIVLADPNLDAWVRSEAQYLLEKEGMAAGMARMEKELARITGVISVFKQVESVANGEGIRHG